MRITRISLTNFRSFKDTQSIDVAPVTLLFGPNSVGKSSVLMALAYVQQILKKGHCDPQKLDALGAKSVGGFRSLVNAQDLKKIIRIRLDYSSGKTPFVHYGMNVEEIARHIQNVNYVLMKDFGGSLETGAVEFEIAWSERFKRAYVKDYRVWVNGIYVGCVHSSEDMKNTLVQELNTLHPLLVPSNNEDWLDSQYGEADEREPLEAGEYHTEFEQVLNQLNPNPPSTAAVSDKEASGEDFVNRIAPIALVCRSGAVPLLGIPVRTNLVGQDFDELDEHFNFLVAQEVLSQAFVLPLDKLLEYLNKSIQIGPLRVVPDDGYIPNPHPEQKDWVDGSAGWDLLYKDPRTDESTKKLIKNTSDWFASTDKLDAGYEIINQSIAEMLNADNFEESTGLFNKRHVFFRELRSNITLSANQLGTGISQVLPILAAANYDELTFISIEQPELHIHPRFQVELADLFLQSKQKHSFLIETHSEHIILRLLKRIRQTTDRELPQNYPPIQEEDVSIVYLEPGENGVVTKRIRVDEDGEFIDRWPQGFFVERREELL